MLEEENDGERKCGESVRLWLEKGAWSGLNHVEEQAWKVNQGDWKKQKHEVKREEWESPRFREQ